MILKDYFNSIVVYVGSTHTSKNLYTLCGKYKNDANLTKMLITINCSETLVGDKVSIIREDNKRRLDICEIKVLGSPIKGKQLVIFYSNEYK